MKEKDVNAAVSRALATLLERDSYLLLKNVNERSISHRFAIYLESQFPGWDVDCEYNRNHDDVKRLQLEARHASDQDIEAITVFPDIIVHHRSKDENLLVIEMKKTGSRENANYDIKKLEAFKKELKYTFAIFVQLETGSERAGIRTLKFI